MTATITERLAEPILQTRITSIARRYGPEAADVRQHITLSLLEKAAADASFAEQRIGYLIKFAAWQARHYAEKSATYDRYVDCEPYVADEEGETSAFDELIPSASPTPEAVCEERQDEAEFYALLRCLSPKQRKVARLLAAGYQPGEVAVKMKLSRSSVSHLIERIRANLPL